MVMPQNKRYLSVTRAQWQHIGFDSVHHIRATKQANQNKLGADIAAKVNAMGSIKERASVLAQILSPTGRIYLNNRVPENITCFPQSVCWRFKERAE